MDFDKGKFDYLLSDLFVLYSNLPLSSLKFQDWEDRNLEDLPLQRLASE